METSSDILVVGGGIVGLASAYALQRSFAVTVNVLEAEPEVATHQTGNNSGVIHSGLYYRPGSLKARHCTRGRLLLLEFCRKHGLAHEVCGKVVVATREEELAALQTLEERGRANGLEGVRRLSAEEIREREPQCAGIAGLWVPQTGIVDFKQVAQALAREICDHGGAVTTGATVTAIRAGPEGVVVTDARGREFRARYLINCAGLQSDRIARLAGLAPALAIIPFRGEYYELKPERHGLVRNLIYPVPDPRFPFLGVHFTRMIHGGVEAGPNAVLAFQREGYRRTAFSWRDVRAMAGYGGFWRMAGRHWRTGLGEMHRSLSKRAFVHALQRLLPAIREEDLVPGGAGVRAQAVAPDGALLDDFCIEQAPGMIHVLNAPSPAATSSLSIGEAIAAMARTSFALKERG
ncbi:MAG TPA: L-2-hydroxyglutarate oxidase [Kiritimatiellia bacterium]|nr:L-2-hydroxyglutarate oxidase [Kiritimatiellia bacterium]HMO98068.1 L-2-hydroxyglutarate oxidase [Kiritimatiellia bacterium]HMP98080.1 L-2-hydroxyglutarate oxidase [Kiritimatiellia bacterium]